MSQTILKRINNDYKFVRPTGMETSSSSSVSSTPNVVSEAIQVSVSSAAPANLNEEGMLNSFHYPFVRSQINSDIVRNQMYKELFTKRTKTKLGSSASAPAQAEDLRRRKLATYGTKLLTNLSDCPQV